MSKFLLTALFALGITLVTAPAMAKRGADDGAGHEAHEHAAGSGTHVEHERHGGGNAGGATGTTNPSGHVRGGNHDANEANEHAAGHDMNDDDLPPTAPAAR